MSYSLSYTDHFRKAIRNLDRQDQIRVLKKIEWIAQNAEIVPHVRLRNPPTHLDGICKYRVGAYRIIYWIEHEKKEIVIYDVIERKREYKNLYR